MHMCASQGVLCVILSLICVLTFRCYDPLDALILVRPMRIRPRTPTSSRRMKRKEIEMLIATHRGRTRLNAMRKAQSGSSVSNTFVGFGSVSARCSSRCPGNTPPRSFFLSFITVDSAQKQRIFPCSRTIKSFFDFQSEIFRGKSRTKRMNKAKTRTLVQCSVAALCKIISLTFDVKLQSC